MLVWIVFLIALALVQNLMAPWTWIGIGFGLVGGVFRWHRVIVLCGVIGVFTLRAYQTMPPPHSFYVNAGWTFAVGATAMAWVLTAYAIGLAVSLRLARQRL